MSFRTLSYVLRGTLVVGTLALAASHPASLAAQQPGDQPIDLSSGSAPGLTDATGETERPLQITGFGVGDYSYAQKTGENSFEASKLAVAFFRELSDNVWFFGQLTTALNGGEWTPGDEVPTEIEIDNFIVNFTPGGGSGVSLSAGKFDLPLGFERDDEPLNLQATNSFNFELGRPVKMVGAMGRWSASPKVDVEAVVGNGWDAQLDPNKSKTVGARVGVLPTENSSLGIGGLYGAEGAGEETPVHDQWVVTGDYAFQPGDWIIAGEANYGGAKDVIQQGETANWYGVTATVFRRLSDKFGATVRGETFRDADGARTGEPQTLQSFTVTPIYFVGSGREGIFANVEHTTFRIPRFQIRAELRYDHSSIDYFEGDNGPTDSQMRYILQLVATI